MTQLEFRSENWRNYAQISIPPLIHYSGHKIGLFFHFKQFYTNKLKYMVPIAFVVQILLWI